MPGTNLDGASSAHVPVGGLHGDGTRTTCDYSRLPAGRANRTWPQLTDEFWHKRAYTGGLNDLMTSNFESWACFKGHPCLETLDTCVSPPTPLQVRLAILFGRARHLFRDAMSGEQSNRKRFSCSTQTWRCYRECLTVEEEAGTQRHCACALVISIAMCGLQVRGRLDVLCLS